MESKPIIFVGINIQEAKLVLLGVNPDYLDGIRDAKARAKDFDFPLEIKDYHYDLLTPELMAYLRDNQLSESEAKNVVYSFVRGFIQHMKDRV